MSRSGKRATPHSDTRARAYVESPTHYCQGRPAYRSRKVARHVARRIFPGDKVHVERCPCPTAGYWTMRSPTRGEPG